MSRPTMKPSDFPCLLSQAPCGLFIHLGRPHLKTARLRPNGTVLAYDEDGCEWTLGDHVMVQPVHVRWGDA